jgi:7,8-dihydropterin-6-yl-methyl-4-(beta-D-ribofuranosyl)aminobenzene 5'-phosphate synthase
VRNIKAMQISIERIEHVIISHWHSDHTGGLLSFLSLRQNAVESSNQTAVACTVDVHPDRPIARGIAPGPAYDKVLCALPSDPTFEAIEKLKGIVDKQKEGHTVAGGSVWVSGEIPRQTEFETGLSGGMRWVEEEGGKWVSDPVSFLFQVLRDVHQVNGSS